MVRVLVTLGQKKIIYLFKLYSPRRTTYDSGSVILSTQWAAVMTNSWSINVPPQWWILPENGIIIWTCHGHSFGAALWPLTMRDDAATPQSSKILKRKWQYTSNVPYMYLNSELMYRILKSKNSQNNMGDTLDFSSRLCIWISLKSQPLSQELERDIDLYLFKTFLIKKRCNVTLNNYKAAR